MYYRYRHNSSASKGSWEYGEVNFSEMPEEDAISELRWMLVEECDWSGLDGYRGCDIEIIEKPPGGWFVSQITEAQARIKRDKARVERYQRVLDKMD